MSFKYRHHVVRDLAWAIASPPLLSPDKQPCTWYKNKWYQDLYTSSLDWLQELDGSPETLQERLDSQKDRRLGRYFETLWAFWLEQSQRFEVVEHNLPLREGSKTLGELDFLVLDKKSGKYLHWEVAVKFYLGIGDTRNHANWYGPGKKDRLDLKVDHLLNRQSVICQHPVAKARLQELGYRVDGCGVILKGRLFYPYGAFDKSLVPSDANPNHLRSYWISMPDFIRQDEMVGEGRKCCNPLVGSGWMAAGGRFSEISLLSVGELVQAVENGDYRLPLHVSYQQKEGENIRIFIVPEGWQDNPGSDVGIRHE